MTLLEENTEKAVQYLFGELDQAERDTLEDRIFSEDEFGIFLSAVEKDLIDDYARGEMDSALRQRFERNYLTSPSRREKVRVAEILQKEVFAEKEIFAPVVVTEAKPSLWQTLAEFFRVPNLALAGGLAAILLFVLLGGWILLRQSPDAPEIVKDDNANRQIQIPTPQPSPEKLPDNENLNTIPPPDNTNKPSNIENKTPEKKVLPANSPTEKRETVPPAPTTTRIFFATLLPSTRSGVKPVLTIPKNSETVRLRVVHDNLQPFAKYRAEVRNQNGNLIFSREIPVNEKTVARPVTLNLKSAALAAGSYELTLSGITDENRAEEIKFYNFTVRKK